MTAPIPGDLDDEDAPLDPAVEKVRRKMVRFFVINIGILMIALMAVLAAIVYKVTRPPEAAALAPANGVVPSGIGALQGSVELMTGERILSQTLSDDRLSLLVGNDEGASAIIIYDIGEGQVISRISVINAP